MRDIELDALLEGLFDDDEDEVLAYPRAIVPSGSCCKYSYTGY